MFGRGHHAHGELSGTARAEVLAVDGTQVALTHGPSPVVGMTEQVWKLKVHVMPNGEEPFDVEFEQAFPQLDAPHVGQTLMVRFDPDDHSKVTVDQSDSGQGGAVAAMVESHLSPEQAATLEQVTGMSVQGLMSAAMTDPEGFATRMRERAEAAQRDAMAQVAAAQAQAGQASPTPKGPTDSVSDVAQTLEKLADLHDRGVLTDAEFQAQKARLLAE